MSDTASSRTKTATGSSESESVEASLVADRWTNNITYRQLVISSCIGIFQLWFHPYVYDLTKLLPFLFLYNIFSVIVGFPQFYLELALGVVTKKGVVDCWDLAPMARGVGFAMLTTACVTALAAGLVAAWCLALFVHSFHSFLPWLHCAAAARPPCAARHRPMPPGGSDTPPMSFFYNFILDLKRDGLGTGFGNIVPELSIYYVITWVLVYCVVIKRIYSYSKLVLFKDVMAYFVLMCCGVGAFRLDGAGLMFQTADWKILYRDIQFWREALEYALLQMTIGQGSLIMLGAYCPKQQHGLTRTSLMAFSVSKTSSMAAAVILGAAHGALMKDYHNETNIQNGTSASMILWADYVARIPGSQFWSALVFFTLFLLALSSAALLVQTIISTLTGHNIRKISWAFLIIACSLFCLVGILTLCTQGGLYALNFLMQWPVVKTRLPVTAIVSLVVTYAYGQSMFCEDVFFAVGEYPCVFLRVCWALSPVLILFIFLIGTGAPGTASINAIGWSMLVFALAPISCFLFIYCFFKFRVRNILTDK